MTDTRPCKGDAFVKAGPRLRREDCENFEPDPPEFTLGEQVQYVIPLLDDAIEAILGVLEDPESAAFVKALAVRRLVENHPKFRDQNWRPDGQRDLVMDRCEELADAIIYVIMEWKRNGVR